ncbi:MAG: diguanylate cyclase, partial [Methylococcales bacterium]|nr:diguanylate cyclase [Methylococcales bacterium]
MPVMDGFEATRIIRNFPRYADLPIIAMTANVMEQDRERCLASGMNSYLAKPVEWDKLFQTLALWVKSNNLPKIHSPSCPSIETRQQDWVSLAEKLPGFDLKNLMTALRVDQEKALHLLDLFKEQLIHDGPEILNHIAAGNLTEAQVGLHKLQGSNVYLGAKDLGYACTALEAELENEQYDALIVTQWQEIYNKTLESLTSLRDKLSVEAIETELSEHLELMTEVMTLLLTDSFINDQQLDQLKIHAPVDQKAENILLVQSIIEGDYLKALAVLKELMKTANKTLINGNSEFTAPSVKPSQVQSKMFTILVVDDERVNQEVLVSLLNEKYQVKVASNGMSALVIAQQQPHPDLILLDVTMPQMDGYEVCRILQNNPETRNISVIFVTAASGHNPEILGLKLGAVDYISKPINPDATLLRIRHQLRLNEHERELVHIAHYDALTDIPNRVLLTDRLKQAISRAKREQKKLAICYIDLDGFKPINDTLGHQTGDGVLVEIAQRINTILRDSDTVARTGGDEFVVLLSNLESQEECKETLKRLHKMIAEPISIQGQSCSVTATIGVSFFPTDDSDPGVLLGLADQAMYLAKQSGKNQFHFFNSMDKQ